MLAPKYGNTTKAKEFRKMLHRAIGKHPDFWGANFERHMARQHSLFELQRVKYNLNKRKGVAGNG